MALEGKDSIVSPGLSGIEIIVFFFSSLASGSIPERLGDTCCQPSSALPSPASSSSLSFALIRRAERRGGREGRRFTAGTHSGGAVLFLGAPQMCDAGRRTFFPGCEAVNNHLVSPLCPPSALKNRFYRHKRESEGDRTGS
jgi:hypothetical protein